MIKAVSGLLIALLALAGSCGTKTTGDKTCDPVTEEVVNVTITDDLGIDLDRTSVSIHWPAGPGQKGKVCWQVSGLDEGYKLKLKRKPETAGRGYFPDLDKSVKGKTGKPGQKRVGEPRKVGEWWYSLTLKRGRRELDHIDPVVIILGGIE